ncbi:MAG: TonB-dependent siderophore receptor [Bryobacteraceae bacterium]
MAPAIDVFNPVYGNFTVPSLNAMPEDRQDQLGVYAQDHIQFAEHWSVMLGIRKDRATSESEGDPESRNVDGAVTGRAGLVYNTNLGLAPYFSFSQSFQPFAGTDIFNNPYEPIRAKQWEAGAKFQPGTSSNLISGAVFDIRQQNRLTPDPSNPLNSIQVGEARIRGVELEGRTKPFWGLNLIVNYGFLDARVSKSNGPDLGKRIPIIPKHFGSFWGVKSFRIDRLPGSLSAGGGIRYNGSSFDGDDLLKTPAYTLYDLMLAYDTSTWRLSINAANLTDKVYVASCLSRGDCFYGIRRAVTATIRNRF